MEKRKDTNKVLTILMIVCVVLSVIILGIVSYDKFLKKKEKEDIKPVTCNCPVCENNSNLGEKVSSVKEITLTDKNQEVKIGNEVFKIKIGTYDGNYGYLSINDYIVNYSLGDGKVPFDEYNHAYLTDKFIFFTHGGQDADLIDYAIGTTGTIVPNNNEYQMHDFKIVNGYLHASGHVFCGLDGDCPDKDLLINYIDNTLIVTEAK